MSKSMSTILQSAIKDFMQNQYQYGSKRLRDISIKAGERISDLVGSTVSQDNDVVVLITGSDGRKENRTDASSIELIVYMDNQESPVVPDIVGGIKDVLMDNLHMSYKTIRESVAKDISYIFLGYNRLSLAKKIYGSNKIDFESKGFEKVGYFQDPYSDYETIFPTRFMDGFRVYGSEESYTKLYNSFATDLSTINVNRLNQFRSRIKYAADISNNGQRAFKDIDIHHFDRDKKQIYYQKTPALETGVKMGQLRYVQYKLGYLITQLIRTKKIDYHQFHELEGFMQSKIDFLRNYVKGGMDEAVIQDLSLIYYTFLKIHHICQKEYKNVEGVYVYELASDEDKLLKEMSLRLDSILTQLTVL